MTQTTRWITTLTSTWLISHGLYLLIHFNPIRDLPGIRGYAVDFAILFVIAFIIYWSLGKFSSKPLKNPNRA